MERREGSADAQELNLVVGHLEPELLDADLDGVPAGQPRCEVDVSAHAKVGRIDDLVGAGHIQDGLGVDAGLVGEGAEACDGVVERHVDLHGLGHHIFDLLELVQLVLGRDIVVVLDDHASEQPTKGLGGGEGLDVSGERKTKKKKKKKRKEKDHGS